MVLPAELLHGITWALSWVAVVTEAKRVAPPGFAGTTQGVFQALFWGLGFGVGALLCRRRAAGRTNRLDEDETQSLLKGAIQ